MKQNIEAASLEDLKRGFSFNEQTREYSCLFCDQKYKRGYIYDGESVLMDAETAVETHVSTMHGGAFEALAQQDKKLTGLTELQRELLGRFRRDEPDKEIAVALGIGSASTIRNHRFALREREKQARIFLALMELVRSKQKDEQNEEALKAPVRLFPRKKNKRDELVEKTLALMTPEQRYSKADANELFATICEDYPALRRHMVDMGVLRRELDGSFYWIEKDTNETSGDDKNMLDKKKLKQ
jgi:DNA-binding CsgD family transcriptional regulator